MTRVPFEAIYWDLYRATRQSPGSIVAKALAGIENVLLDIKAKALGVPVYELFGGPTRATIPMYWSHCGTTRARAFEVTGTAKLAVVRRRRRHSARGRRARLRSLQDERRRPRRRPEGAHARVQRGRRDAPGREIADALVRLLEAFRDGTGDRARPIVDLNFNLEPEGCVRVAKALDPFDLLWLEVDLFDAGALAHVRHVAPMPICSGENLYGSRDFRPYLEAGGMDVASVDVIWNGFHQAKKIADLAETFEVNCAPHNYYSHLATFIAAQWCAAIPNARILEYDVDDVPWRDELVTALPEFSAGELGFRTGRGGASSSTRTCCASTPGRGELVPVGLERAESALQRERQLPVAPAELHSRELRELVRGCVGNPAPLPRVPQPLDLAPRVPGSGASQRAASRSRPAAYDRSAETPESKKRLNAAAIE